MDEMTAQAEVETAPRSEASTPAVNAPEDTKALVKRWAAKIRAAKKHFSQAFEDMREDMRLARLGSTKEWHDGGNYVVPLTARHINQAVAAIYAKNPKAYARPKRRLLSTVWDGDPQVLQAAMQARDMGMQTGVINPMAEALIADAAAVQAERAMWKRVGQTAEILFDYFLNEQEPKFKKRFKQAVIRAKICGVAYVQLDFQRIFKYPEVQAEIVDVTSKMARLETLLQMAAEGDLDAQHAEMAELKSLLADLQQKAELIAREGPLYDFPRSTEVIVDPRCSQLDGFIGAEWIARERKLHPIEVREIYGVDVKSGYTAYKSGATTTLYPEEEGDEKCAGLVCVWTVQHKKNQQTFTIADGYADFLRPPAEPDVQIERFWTIFPLMFNAVEDEELIYPMSDTRALKHPQMEYNRARQGLAEHRHANRPGYAVREGLLGEEDKIRLETRPPHAVIPLRSLAEEQTIDAILQPLKGAPIDPALYDTSAVMDDVLRGVGTQEATIGGVSNGTATESSIAQGERQTVQQDNVDAIDDLLSDLAAATMQLMLAELSEQTVKEIAGPGAVWPTLNREQAYREIYLDVKAGSSGRPNRAAELANNERAMPYIMQLPGINPVPIGKNYLELLNIDADDAQIDGLPSITAMNALAGRPQVQPGTGDPASDPNAQGSEGGQNAQQPAGNEPGGQPAYPVGDGTVPVSA